jgi:hypothetical protein
MDLTPTRSLSPLLNRYVEEQDLLALVSKGCALCCELQYLFQICSFGLPAQPTH